MGFTIWFSVIIAIFMPTLKYDARIANLVPYLIFLQYH